jgi:putative ABC transport system permease protein
MPTRDVRDSWRSLAWSPYFTIPVVLSLALAIGGNVAAFSVINTLVLRPLPVAAPDRLFHITYVGQSGTSEGGNYAWFDLVRSRTRAGAEAFIDHRQSNMKVVVDGQIEALNGTAVSGGYFSGLGLTPQLGRLISSADETGATRTPVAVISDAYWTRRFGRDPAVIGRTIRVDTVAHEIVGVTPPNFVGLEVGRTFDITVPIDAAEYRQGWVSMSILTRLGPEMSVEAVSQELTTLLQEFAKSVPASRATARFQRVELVPIARGLHTEGGVRDRYVTPAAAVAVIIGMMLLLACSNWAMLFLARASARRRDMTIRLALGSTQTQLVRQLFIESLSLAIGGGILGLVLAAWAVAYLPGNGLPAGLTIGLDFRVVLFAVGVTLATGTLLAVAPAALTRRLHPHELRASGKVDTAHTARMGHGLVVLQVALSLLLVVAAAFFATTLRNLKGQAMGFSTDGVVTFSLDADGTGLEGEALTALHRQILARLRALPGVQHATLATVPPLSGNEDGKAIAIPGFEPASADDLNAQVDTVGPDYFATFGIPVVRGRAITEADTQQAPHVALLSESAARYYFPGADPIGRQMEIKGSTTLHPEIVGIVPDVMYRDLRTSTARMFYVPFYQRYAEGEYVFAVRAAGSVDALVHQIPLEINALAPSMPVLDIRTLARQLDEHTANERLLASMSGFFGALALILAGIGIYGIVAYSVARRIPELGVRLALGAARRHVVWQIARGSVAVVAAGLAIGVAIVMSVGEKLNALLFGIDANDSRVYVSAAMSLLGVGALAAIPAVLRALRIDPVSALRSE